MHNNYSIAERNKIVEEHLWCIDAVMKKERKLIASARLDRDDVYQQLAERLIRSVRTFDPDKGEFVPYAMDQLRRELRSMDTPLARYGMTGAPRSFSAYDQMSLDCPDADYGFPAYAAA